MEKSEKRTNNNQNLRNIMDRNPSAFSDFFDEKVV